MRNCVTLLLWGLLFFCGMAAGQEPRALTPKNPIRLTKVQGRMDHLGVDVKGRRLFATAFDNHTLEVIDLKTGRQVHTITDLDEPQRPEAIREHRGRGCSRSSSRRIPITTRRSERSRRASERRPASSHPLWGNSSLPQDVSRAERAGKSSSTTRNRSCKRRRVYDR